MPPRPAIAFVCQASNDLFRVAADSGLSPLRFDSVAQAIDQAADGSALLVLADGYPEARTPVRAHDYDLAAGKSLRVYVEFPSHLPRAELGGVRRTAAERAVVASDAFGATLQKHRILMITDCQFVEASAHSPLLVCARVAGFDTAVFGLPETDVWPILFELPGDNVMVATTKLSHFVTGRYAPAEAWDTVWAKILGYLLPGQARPRLRWSPTVHPTFGPKAPLPADAAMNAFRAGTDWFVKAPMLRDAAGGVSEQADGQFGVSQCFVAKINLDGSQPRSLDQRNDCNGEVAMALALRSRLDPKARRYGEIAANLVDSSFNAFQAGSRNDPQSPSYGLMSWAPGGAMDIYFADDNARALLGSLAAAAALKTDRWDRRIARAILANFRCSGPRAFQGHNLFEPNVQKYGWLHYWDRDEPLYAPHFESWIWACYLWLYARTGFAPLLTKTRAGIAAMMAAYPHDWHWTNGLQQERARMLLPLAWLVRVADTPEHRAWLYRIADDLLACQDECGAIREELGSAGHGRYGPPASNEKYATSEAPLIQNNGDPVADMLYTSNFAMVSLTEAAAAVGDARLDRAADKLAEFMVRIQVCSTAHPELHASWFRAFDYKRWEYWASNADAGWGAWCNETGWTVGWIASMLALRANKTNFWDFTAASTIADVARQEREALLPDAILSQPARARAKAAGSTRVPLAFEDPWTCKIGFDLDTVVDLGAAKPIKGLAVEFSYLASSCLKVPGFIELSVSEDKADWSVVHSEHPPAPADTGKMQVCVVKTPPLALTGRYVRLRAARGTEMVPTTSGLLQAPGSDRPTWIFCDSILVD